MVAEPSSEGFWATALATATNRPMSGFLSSVSCCRPQGQEHRQHTWAVSLAAHQFNIMRGARAHTHDLSYVIALKISHMSKLSIAFSAGQGWLLLDKRQKDFHASPSPSAWHIARFP